MQPKPNRPAKPAVHSTGVLAPPRQMTYKPVPPAEADPVARSVARPDAFSKPGSLGSKQGMRFRPLHVKGKRPVRKRRPDPRYVRFY